MRKEKRSSRWRPLCRGCRWVRNVALIIGGGLTLLYIIAFALTFTPRYEQVPDEAWRSQDLSVINRAAHEALSRGSAEVDAALAALLGSDPSLHAVPTSPPLLTETAETWAQAINRYNPEAILYQETDPRGNIYVVLGGWWTLLDGDEQLQALDGLGVAWRHYLSNQLGNWDTSEGFEPGIVVVDEHGEVARNLNGEIKIFRAT